MESNTQLRQRQTEKDNAQKNEQKDGEEVEDFDLEHLVDEDALENRTKSSPIVSGGTDKTPEVLESSLAGLPSRWKNWVIRGIFTWLMIFFFVFMIYLGPIALMMLVLIIQVMCFNEIINIGYIVYKTHDLPWFRSLSWYFLLTSNYFFYGENMVDYFRFFIRKAEGFQFLATYHRFISFTLYVIGFVWFVLSLVKKYYLRQFSMFAYTHVALLVLVVQSHFIIQNVFEGLVWFLVPVSLIICNDIMAYMFGFFFGKTPLIKLSPKKTWEGFIGGMFSTIVFGLILASFLIRYQWFICPVQLDDEGIHLNCSPSLTFQPQEYTIPLLKKQITLIPFHLHTLAMSLFSSIIGPFGGFFASGFKRAFKIKDFGDLIPGHGGMMDRFDCQLLMATFVNVYIYSFIRHSTPEKIVQQIAFMKNEDQLAVFELLYQHLNDTGLIKA